MSFKRSAVAVLLTSIFAASSASAEKILIISDALKPGVTLASYINNDDALVTFLEGLGHTVDTAGMHQGGVSDDGGPFREPAAFSTLTTYLASNPVDLIVFSRATAVSAYNDAKKDWNELDVPLLLMNGFLPRATAGWQWTAGTTQETKTAAAFDVVLPTHSFVTGLDTSAPVGEIEVFLSDVSFESLQTTAYVSGAQIVATVEDGTPALVDIPAGTVFGGDASLYGTSSKRRVFFAYENYFTPPPGRFFDDNISSGATDSGEALLRQVIASMLANPEAEPTNDGGGGGGGAVTSPEPATSVLLLSGLIALAGFGRTGSSRRS